MANKPTPAAPAAPVAPVAPPAATPPEAPVVPSVDAVTEITSPATAVKAKKSAGIVRLTNLAPSIQYLGTIRLLPDPDEEGVDVPAEEWDKYKDRPEIQYLIKAKQLRVKE